MGIEPVAGEPVAPLITGTAVALSCVERACAAVGSCTGRILIDAAVGDTQFLGIIGVNLYDLCLDIDLLRIGQLQQIDDIGIFQFLICIKPQIVYHIRPDAVTAAAAGLFRCRSGLIIHIQGSDMEGHILLPLVLHHAPQQHPAVGHLHPHPRQVDSPLDSQGQTIVIRRDAYHIIIAHAICSPEHQAGGALLQPHDIDFTAAESLHIGYGRIGDGYPHDGRPQIQIAGFIHLQHQGLGSRRHLRRRVKGSCRSQKAQGNGLPQICCICHYHLASDLVPGPLKI